jgi:hypothetical protein
MFAPFMAVGAALVPCDVVLTMTYPAAEIATELRPSQTPRGRF